MKLKNNNHLMYCLNIHTGENLSDVMKSIDEYALKVKARVCPDKPFALGLRLSDAAATELLTRLGDFKDYLIKNDLYVVSINGFPFGSFHDAEVREKVYQPDWTTHERVSYTLNLSHILSELLPEGETGTISTVPLYYGKAQNEKFFPGIIFTSVFLKRLKERTGKHIVLCLEPEPDCCLDTLASTMDFFSKIFLMSSSAKEHLGVCLDTCHALVEFESPLAWLAGAAELGIRMPKIQLSAAIKTDKPKTLENFKDRNYLHQTRIRATGGVTKFADLSQALQNPLEGEWRAHFHVPLTWQGEGISSTGELIEQEFFEKLENKHLEVETYSYDVMPQPKKPLLDSIVSELEWAKEKFISK